MGTSRDSLAWTSWQAQGERFAASSVGLVSLASLVPETDEVVILDQKIGDTVSEQNADLVGISFKTMYADDAYALADAYRARGVPVALGGLHATLQPEEASSHADSVVVGEGEGVWPELLQDAKNGTLKSLYRAPVPPPPINALPKQRSDLVRHASYFFHSIQTARGCSLDCEFCPTRAMFGEGFRLRTVDAVVEEAGALLDIERKPIFFTDDVFGAGDATFIKLVTQRLGSLDATYTVICDLAMLTPEIIEQLAGSGCRIMTINMPGTCTPEECEAVKQIQSAGISVWGYFMFGFEFHKPDLFDRVIDFVEKCEIRHTSLTVLSPYPGTPMGERLKKEGRILSEDYTLYDQSHVVFKPAGMNSEQLESGYSKVVSAIGDRCNMDRVAANLGV